MAGSPFDCLFGQRYISGVRGDQKQIESAVWPIFIVILRFFVGLVEHWWLSGSL